MTGAARESSRAISWPGMNNRAMTRAGSGGAAASA